MPRFSSLLAVAPLILLAPSASAFSIYFDSSGQTLSLAASDTVYIDVLADIDVLGLELMGVAVLFDPTQVTYIQAASSTPSYMLYSPAAGTLSSVYMVPSQSPPQLWPAPPPGFEEVIVNWQLANILGPPTQITGNGLLLATLAFHVAPKALTQISLSLSAPGTIIRVNGAGLNPPPTLGLPVVIIPEPATVLLVACGFVGLAIHRARS